MKKLDLYTKAVLTLIAILLAVLLSERLDLLTSVQAKPISDDEYYSNDDIYHKVAYSCDFGHQIPLKADSCSR